MNAPTGKITAAPLVFQKIAAVQGELSKVGISKDRRNQQQGYNFRGIDEVYSALSPLLAKHGLVIVPRVIERECIEGTTRKGDPLFRVTVHAEFDFIAAEDGSIHTAATYGEAMDSADKATNKAMSAAYKYAAFMTFAIPTEGDNDADAVTPEPASQTGSAKGQTGGRKEPGADPANDQQAAITKIISLCQALGGNQSQLVCEAYKVSSFNELTSTQAAAVIKRLTAKLAEKVEAEKAPPAAGFAEILEDEIPF